MRACETIRMLCALARRSAPILVALACGVPVLAQARPKALCATAGRSAKAPVIAIVSAFPAELAPLVAATAIDSTVEVDGRQYYTGRLNGVHVVLGLTGIGLVNADTTARTVLEHFAPAALLMSGVAGSPNRIAEVVVPDDWMLGDATDVFPVNPALAAIAARAKAALPAPLEHCTRVPPGSASAAFVCLPFEPQVILGGHGVSSDPYGGMAFPCGGGGDVFGCELPAPSSGAIAAAVTTPDIEDMETAAVATAAIDHDVPFLAMRAVSDGAGDPLGDRGFPTQFFDYYVLAARNAALVTGTVVGEVANLRTDRRGRRVCHLLARRRWDRAAIRLRAP
jgi:adenosylhomocysteine nucleosidase